jgi:hypothetical protein
MKNIQVIDSAINCVYDIFAATDEEFDLLFPEGSDIAFIDEIFSRLPKKKLVQMFEKIWARPVRKRDAMGIHGVLFYQLEVKKQYYPTRKDDEAINPDGSLLRAKRPSR